MQYIKVLKNLANINYIINTKSNISYLFVFKESRFFSYILNVNINSLVSSGCLYLFCPSQSMLNTSYTSLLNLIYSNYIYYFLKIEVKGIGYRFLIEKDCVYVFIGYSHPIKIFLTKEIQIKGSSKEIIIMNYNKYVLGNIYHFLKKLRKKDVYKGKGIKRVYDILTLKIGKSRLIKNK